MIMGGRVRPGCILLLLLSLLFVTPKGYAQEPLPAIGQPIKGSDLELLLKTLENPSERDKLIKQLKSLIALQKREKPTAYKKAEKIPSLEQKLKATNVFLLYQKTGEGLKALPLQLKKYINNLPRYFSSLRQYLSKKEHIFLVLDMVIKFLLASLIAWAVFYYVN